MILKPLTHVSTELEIYDPLVGVSIIEHRAIAHYDNQGMKLPEPVATLSYVAQGWRAASCAKQIIATGYSREAVQDATDAYMARYRAALGE